MTTGADDAEYKKPKVVLDPHPPFECLKHESFTYLQHPPPHPASSPSHPHHDEYSIRSDDGGGGKSGKGDESGPPPLFSTGVSAGGDAAAAQRTEGNPTREAGSAINMHQGCLHALPVFKAIYFKNLINTPQMGQP